MSYERKVENGPSIWRIEGRAFQTEGRHVKGPEAGKVLAHHGK